MILADRPRSPSRAKRIARCAAFLSLLVVPATAGAGTYYASPGGSSSNSGSISSPWSLAKANSALKAGDVCYFLPGTYSGDIDPSFSGSSSARISYIGSVSDPSQVTIGSISIGGKSYVTVKGMHATGGIDLTATTGGIAASYDSVSGCKVDGGLYLAGAWNSAVVGNTIGTGDTQDKWSMQTANRGYAGATATAYCTISGNTFNLGGVAQPHVVEMAGTRHCTISRNRVTMTIPAGAFDVHGRTFYGVQHVKFSDNFWQLRNQTTYNPYIHNCRDSTSFNTFLRDTLLEAGPGPVRIWSATSGSYPGSVRGNRYDHVYVRANLGYSWYYQNGMRQDTLSHCTIINTGGPAFIIDNVDMEGPILIDHNTFVGNNQPGVVHIDPSNSALEDSVVITNNIFYNLNHGVEGRQSCSVVRSAAYVVKGLSPLRMNNNLYSYYGYINTPGDKSLGFSYNCDPGQYAVGGSSAWCTSNGQDCNSRYGSPRFADSTAAGFNPRLLSGSIAIGRATDRGDVGAYPFAGEGPDLPPSSVPDLAVRVVYDNNLELGWTAPSDDRSGGVAAYDLRISTSPISSGDFGSATPVVVQPLPLSAGVAQSYLVFDLIPSTTYYFAIKSRDDQGHWSTLSNVASVTTRTSDGEPPATIGDLTTTP